MTTPPLSPAAQAVLDAVERVPVPHGQAFPLIRLEIAAAIRALVEQTLPEEGHTLPIHIPSAEWLRFDERKKIRGDQLAIAAELYGGAGALTRTMVVCPICGNKRCPHATDPALACTGSNEPDQPGSIYTTQPTETPDEHA